MGGREQIVLLLRYKFFIFLRVKISSGISDRLQEDMSNDSHFFHNEMKAGKLVKLLLEIEKIFIFFNLVKKKGNLIIWFPNKINDSKERLFSIKRGISDKPHIVNLRSDKRGRFWK
jgi:hypothetical protein